MKHAVHKGSTSWLPTMEMQGHRRQSGLAPDVKGCVSMCHDSSLVRH